MILRFFTLLSLGIIGASTAYGADIHVFVPFEGSPYATVGEKSYRCNIGYKGCSDDKKEGDGCTPVGDFPLREIFFRKDRLEEKELSETKLPSRPLTEKDGWCDDPLSPEHYNKWIDLDQFAQTSEKTPGHEKLFREDHVYDILVVVGYNDSPPIPKKGSAIFIHLARENYPGTAGCVVFSKEDLLEIISQLDKESQIHIKRI